MNKVLIIDDERNILDSLSGILEDEGFSVLKATDGKEGLAIFEREAPDAVVQTLLVIDATSGQNAVIQTATFTEVSDVTGLVLTKLDGSAKGGVAIAVARETGLPLCLAGLGEGVGDLQDFDRSLFLEALLPQA